MKVSLWLPTFTHGDPDFRQIADRAREAERLGYSGIYLLDHLLPISGVHESAWLETMVGLGVLAGCTEEVTLGTASLIVGYRHPVLLAKQLASVASVAGPRVVLGASAGWFGPEYEAFGYRLRERGGRTNETLEATRLLLTNDAVSYEGRYWRFSDVTIAPRPSFSIPFYIGGGSRTKDAGSEADLAVLSPPVLRRISTWDGWLASCAGSDDLTFSDLALVRDERPDPGFRLLHVQWTHVVDTEDREEALREQLPLFRDLMGSQHTDRHFRDTYLVGSLSDIRRRVARLRERGFEELILGPVVHDMRQVEMIAELLMPTAAGSKSREG